MSNEILIGDALTVLRKLPDAVVDVGVTSPPYNKKEKNKGWLVNSVHYDSYKDVLPESDYQAKQVKVLDEIYRVTKDGGAFFYNHKLRWEKGKLLHPLNWLAKTKWHIRQEIIWDRKIAANIRGWRFWQVEERIYWLEKEDPQKPATKSIGRELGSRHAQLSSIWRFPPERDNPHPAPFPIALPTRAIFSILDGKPGLVLDPYVGSGTSLLAAHLLGCSSLGIEISAKYAAQASKRLTAPSKKDIASFHAECARHKIAKTFAQRKKSGSSSVGKFAGPQKTQQMRS